MKQRRGFTLVELLVVISIIGLLSTLAVVSLNSARQKARDAKRIADVKQIQTAMELYYNDKQGYPTLFGDAQTELTLGSGEDCNTATCSCLGTDGFGSTCTGQILMGMIPPSPKPPADNKYVYFSYSGGSNCIPSLGAKCDEYIIQFALERPMTDLGDGTLCEAKPSGVKCCTTRPCS